MQTSSLVVFILFPIYEIGDESYFSPHRAYCPPYSKVLENVQDGCRNSPPSLYWTHWSGSIWPWVGLTIHPIFASDNYLNGLFECRRMTSYKEIRKSLGLLSTRQQGHTVETICDAIVDLWKQFPKAGAWDMTSLLFHRKGMSVSKYVFKFNSSKL